MVGEERMKILIKQGLLNGQPVDLLVDGKYIARIDSNIEEDADVTIDASDKAILPPYVNAHTHAAMTLLRGYADDMELMDWLQNKIWPLEAKLTEEDIYVGTKLACLEMIKSGTAYFVDMYWHLPGIVKAVEEMGLKALLSGVIIDSFDEKQAEAMQKKNEKLFKELKWSDNVQFCLGPHAIYTVSEKSLKWVRNFATEHKIPITIHLSETEYVVSECEKRYGMRPVEFLDSIGFLGSDVIAAHCVHLSDKEIEILKRDQVIVAHNPISNMKLCSGVMPFERLSKAGVEITLGTDGCSSNNNLNMADEMKMMALIHKSASGNPKLASADEVYACATDNRIKHLFPETGKIEAGKRADLILVDLTHPQMQPNHNLISNLVYSGTGDVVDTMIIDGKILMQDKHVTDEDEIRQQVKKTVQEILSR